MRTRRRPGSPRARRRPRPSSRSSSAPACSPPPDMASGARHLVVGRLRKPHGLKGEITVFPLTDDPQAVFAPGRSVWVVNLEGEEVAGPFEIERSRDYHREWLMKIRGVELRDAWEPWRGLFL